MSCIKVVLDPCLQVRLGKCRKQASMAFFERKYLKRLRKKIS
jgi:hypothetical protein